MQVIDGLHSTLRPRRPWLVVVVLVAAVVVVVGAWVVVSWPRGATNSGGRPPVATKFCDHDFPIAGGNPAARTPTSTLQALETNVEASWRERPAPISEDIAQMVEAFRAAAGGDGGRAFIAAKPAMKRIDTYAAAHC